MAKRKAASLSTVQPRRSKRLRKLAQPRTYFDLFSRQDAQKFVECVKDHPVDKSDYNKISESCSNLDMAITLLRIHGFVGMCAREEFRTLVDTDEIRAPGEGLGLSFEECDKRKFIELMELMSGNISRVIIRRASVPNWYAEVLRRYMGNMEEVVIDMTTADTESAHEFRKLMTMERAEPSSEECSFILNSILDAFNSIDELVVNVYQLNKYYIEALTNHASKVRELTVSYIHYDIYFAYTFASVARAAGPSLHGLNVIGKLARDREPSFLRLREASEVCPNCIVTFNGKTVSAAMVRSIIPKIEI